MYIQYFNGMKFAYFQGISLSYSKLLIDGMHEKRPWLTFDLRSNSFIVAKGIFFCRENQEIYQKSLGLDNSFKVPNGSWDHPCL